MPRFARALPAVVGLAVIAAGCSSDETTPSVAGFADAKAISQEFADTKESLDLPEGVQWPQVDFDGEAYSTGYGSERAYEIWQCAWLEGAVSGSKATREEAMTQLTGFLDTEQFAELEVARRDIFESAVADAAEGDAEGLAEFLRASCDGLS